MTVFQRLIQSKNSFKAAYLILIDPDKLPRNEVRDFVETACRESVDGFLVGGSLLQTPDLDSFVTAVKTAAADKPVILFPGSVQQLSPQADAVLFLSLLSGRNAQHLIGSQVMAAPILYKLGLEAIATAYLLVESGRPTSAEFMSGTTPLPRHKPEIAVAHALAAQYLGFQTIYLEAGSGADMPVPDEIVAAISRTVKTPLIVGGGIRTPEEAAAKVKAGASFIVTGNVLEKNNDGKFIRAFAKAIHHGE
jgi:putative glycerol-1-phosphate prenyltransferase